MYQLYIYYRLGQAKPKPYAYIHTHSRTAFDSSTHNYCVIIQYYTSHLTYPQHSHTLLTHAFTNGDRITPYIARDIVFQSGLKCEACMHISFDIDFLYFVDVFSITLFSFGGDAAARFNCAPTTQLATFPLSARYIFLSFIHFLFIISKLEVKFNGLFSFSFRFTCSTSTTTHLCVSVSDWSSNSVSHEMMIPCILFSNFIERLAHQPQPLSNRVCSHVCAFRVHVYTFYCSNKYNELLS